MRFKLQTELINKKSVFLEIVLYKSFSIYDKPIELFLEGKSSNRNAFRKGIHLFPFPWQMWPLKGTRKLLHPLPFPALSRSLLSWEPIRELEQFLAALAILLGACWEAMWFAA